MRDDLDELLTCWRYKSRAQRKAVRTTNAIERRFREVRRRTRPMGVFSDRTSMDRILFAVDYPYEAMEPAARWIERAPISEIDRRKIAAGNARRLFKLDRT